jgi:class 3 adenylate cyclase
MAGRRLTAILAADIAGYSALMGSNDVETVADLKGHQSAILPMIAGYTGRVIDTAGDGILAEFPSVFNAVKCAMSIQEVMLERNASIIPARRMLFRIGINQGDVLFDEDRIYGDGINVAARLEAICEPGCICISAKVYEEIKGRFEIQYEDIGEQTLKNIASPVRTYKISISGTPPRANDKSVKLSSWPFRIGLIAAGVPLILAVVAGAAWWGFNGSQSAGRTDRIPVGTKQTELPQEKSEPARIASPEPTRDVLGPTSPSVAESLVCGSAPDCG